MNEGVIWHLSESCHRFRLSSSFYRWYGWDQVTTTTDHTYKVSSLFTTHLLTDHPHWDGLLPQSRSEPEPFSGTVAEHRGSVWWVCRESYPHFCRHHRGGMRFSLKTEKSKQITSSIKYFSQIIKKNKRCKPGEGSKDVRGTQPDQSPCPVVRVQRVTDSPVLPHKHDLSPAVSDSLDIS